VLETARRAVYPMRRLETFPVEYLKRFCLKGTGPEAGNMAIDRGLRARVSFMRLNLNESLPDVGLFDVIFLRNVLIYFDAETKRRVLERVCAQLVDDGRFIVSHSESLHGLAPMLAQQEPSIYLRA
jgi:chemotaxis protein methyltransferase CheR